MPGLGRAFLFDTKQNNNRSNQSVVTRLRTAQINGDIVARHQSYRIK
ncbi:hypothetical protein C942_02115 [Photobacterium marinum]|uniref:Uncharacterized protein n=1 Tax=Photobacterium marinum TaxID=1056511 RepID=L8J882_9GAMM|nr:hypothetical protein C942_02115 [Photobacterium marinum]